MASIQIPDMRSIDEIMRMKDAMPDSDSRKVERPWGRYTVILEGRNYKIKIVEIPSGNRMSLQLHRRRSEHWVVISGVASVTRGNDVFLLHLNESTFIPENTKHRLENPGKEPLMIIEVQSGTYVGEDDIIRFKDDYGRKLISTGNSG